MILFENRITLRIEELNFFVICEVVIFSDSASHYGKTIHYLLCDNWEKLRKLIVIGSIFFTGMKSVGNAHLTSLGEVHICLHISILRPGNSKPFPNYEKTGATPLSLLPRGWLRLN